ncbi:MAG TPA: radical SAM protein, partial [Rhodomicrobium sp.]|nr:radical SAM protein [Rhodomicrobium sp.]
EDHKVLLEKGVWMDPDMNKYDLNHRHHPKMSDAEWEEALQAAWASFYSPEYIRTILRRVAANPKGRPSATLSKILWFKVIQAYEGVHPLEGGALRLKFRRDRRSGLPIESPFIFYPHYFGETIGKAWRYWSTYRQSRAILKEVRSAPDRLTYTDVAIATPRADEFEALDLYQATSGAEAALARKQLHDSIRSRVRAPAAVKAAE